MSRSQGTVNKELAVPDTVRLTTEERVELLANLIVDRIVEDAASDQMLLKSMGGTDDTQQRLTLA